MIAFHIPLFVLTMFISVTLQAQPLVFTSGKEKNQLIELYTSEGCSSCPPADRWISKLVKHDDLWTDVIPIAFHVDYWDQLGWKDAFGRADFSDRQRQYRREGQISQVYTPGFVVDGQEWRGFFRHQKLDKSTAADVGEITVKISAQTVEAQFVPQYTAAEQLIFHIAVLGFDINNDIEAGENSGKTLKHDFAVIAYDQRQASRQNNLFAVNLNLPRTEHRVNRKAVVVWVSETHSQVPVQVTGNWL